MKYGQGGYNRGQYNISRGGSDSMSGFAALAYGINTPRAMARVSIAAQSVGIRYSSVAQAVSGVVMASEPAGIAYSIEGRPTLAVLITAPDVGIVFGTLPVVAQVVGAQSMTIVGTFRPGDMLIIDTDQLTATLNGVNAMHMVDITQFVLVPGEDEIFFTGNVNTELDVKIMWKNRWV